MSTKMPKPSLQHFIVEFSGRIKLYDYCVPYFSLRHSVCGPSPRVKRMRSIETSLLVSLPLCVFCSAHAAPRNFHWVDAQRRNKKKKKRSLALRESGSL